jgi:hypothetical protein
MGCSFLRWPLYTLAVWSLALNPQHPEWRALHDQVVGSAVQYATGYSGAPGAHVASSAGFVDAAYFARLQHHRF